MTRSSAPPGSTEAPVSVQVFGGLRLLRPVADLAHRPPRERVILACLLAARGRTISVSALIDCLWGEAPPSTAVNQVQRHVGELRRLLEPGLPARTAGTAIHGIGEGYRIEPSVIDSDLDRVSALAITARSLSPDAAAPMYAEALALAAGTPFSGLDWDILSRPEFAAIERDRIALALDAATCALELRDPVPLVDAIERIAADAPLDERLQARLVRLLGRIGRRAEAMAVYDATRRRLGDELSAAPGVELLDALDEVLTEDDPAPRRAVAPRKLPLAPGAIVERSGVSGLLEDATDSALRGEQAILAISGMAGIGKTTLALQWAHSVADRFPDGQLFLNLRGYAPAGEAITTIYALRKLIADLGGSAAGLPEDETALGAAYRNALADRRVLMLIDNVADIAQARALLPGAPGCLVIVTSRAHLAGLVVQDGAVPVTLDRLTDEQSHEVLAKRLGAERLRSDPSAVESIIASCVGLPLALALAAAASAAGSRDTMHSVADGLAATASALDALALDDDNNLRSQFEWSYRLLTDDAARVFRLVSVHVGMTHPRRAIASIAGFDLPRTSVALSELVRANMIVKMSNDVYTIHDLLLAYARELAEASGERPDAQRRMIQHYVQTTRRAFLTFGREPVVEVDQAPPVPEAITNFSAPDEAVQWYQLERMAIVKTFALALELGLDHEAALIALDWRPMRAYTDGPSELVSACIQATDAAARSGDERLEVELRRDLAVQLGMTGQDEESLEQFGRVLETYRAWGDHAGEANTLRNLLEVVRSPQEQLDLSAQAVEAARRSGRSDILAVCLVSRCGPLFIYGSTDELEAVTDEAELHVRMSKAEYLLPYVELNRAFVLARRGRFQAALEAVRTTEQSLDLMIQWMGALATVLAAAGVDRRDLAFEARDRFARLANEHGDFLGLGTFLYPLYWMWIDDALAAMEARLSP